MNMLLGKVAIVTGGGQGVGRGEAFALAREAAAVAVVDMNEETGSRTAQEIADLGGKAMFVGCDVRNRADVEATLDAVVAELGTPDILVNNAQIIPNPTPLEDWTEGQLRDCYESGLLGSFFFMLACFPHMKAKGGGRIINTASASGHGISAPGFSGYGAAKEAIRALTRSAAREWGVHGITVNAISPSSLSPAAVAIYPSEEEQVGLLQAAGAAIPRWSDPEADIGGTLVFLCSPAARQITGCTISVDGGLAMI